VIERSEFTGNEKAVELAGSGLLCFRIGESVYHRPSLVINDKTQIDDWWQREPDTVRGDSRKNSTHLNLQVSECRSVSFRARDVCVGSRITVQYSGELDWPLAPVINHIPTR